MHDEGDLKHSAQELQRQRAQDAFDLHSELTGHETGRPRRFIAETDQRRQQRERDDERDWCLFIAATQSQVEQFSLRLEELERAGILALQRTDQRLAVAERDLEEVRRLAMRNAFGQAVYRSADKTKAFFDDARQLTDDERDAIPWRDGTPTWEERQAVGQSVRDATERQQAVAQYLDSLHTIRGRLEGAGPLGAAELEDLQRQAEAIPTEIVEELSHEERSAAEHRSTPAATTISPFIPKP